jgi:hypothetical protein
METHAKKLIFIELNEVNLDFVKKYSLKFNFKFFNKFFFDRLKKTYSEKEYNLLEPWIQWVSIHTGKTAEEHKVFRLGDIKNFYHEQIFENIEKRSKSVGVICAMNAKNNLINPHYFISDPWTNTNSEPGKWNKFVANNLSRMINFNSHNKIPIKVYINILIILLISFRLINLKTYFKFIIKSVTKKWFKALVLDLLLHDIHVKQLKKKNTDFTSIFFNAGAHIQHHYFTNSIYCDNKKLKNPAWYINKTEDPIKDMILFYDDILYEYTKIKNYEVILATGLSQKPYDRVKYYYRLKNHSNFLKILKINFLRVEPRMTRDFLISFSNKKDLDFAAQRLEEINLLNKEQIFKFDKRIDSIFVSLVISQEINGNYNLFIENNFSIPLKNYVVFVALKNGMHDDVGYFFSTWKTNVLHVKDIYFEIQNFFAK